MLASRVLACPARRSSTVTAKTVTYRQGWTMSTGSCALVVLGQSGEMIKTGLH